MKAEHARQAIIDAYDTLGYMSRAPVGGVFDDLREVTLLYVKRRCEELKQELTGEVKN